MRRLIDLEGMRELEQKALMTSRFADADARDAYPELDAASRALFGLTADEADTAPRPAGWDGIERKPVAQQVEAFEREGWDVTDGRRRPLRLFAHFNAQLWLAVRGAAGSLPFSPEPEETGQGWGAALKADATRFRRDRR